VIVHNWRKERGGKDDPVKLGPASFRSQLG
jgi:hypothetical protein